MICGNMLTILLSHETEQQLCYCKPQWGTHLQPVTVEHLFSNIGCVCADGQLYGSGHCKPPPLHPKWHEAGAEHCSPHVHIQVWYMDVWLPEMTINQLEIKVDYLNLDCFNFSTLHIVTSHTLLEWKSQTTNMKL